MNRKRLVLYLGNKSTYIETKWNSSLDWIHMDVYNEKTKQVEEAFRIRMDNIMANKTVISQIKPNYKVLTELREEIK